jgi:LPS-assembly protein
MLALSALAGAQEPASTQAIPVAAPTSQRPVQSKQPPPAADPSTLSVGEWVITPLSPADCADCTQSLEGKVRKLHAHPAEMLDSRMLFRADDIVYDGETGDLHAEGHVYFYDFARNEKIWCDKLDYHTEKGNEHGTFTNVVGETQPRIISKPGFLTSSAPFHFEGEWAERDETKYILHNGWITNCTLPKPWWRLRGPKFDIIPRDRAKAYDSTFLLGGIPVFYFPWFYHPLKPEPRKSGFLLPSPIHSSLRGWSMGVGYFWAINRSYDITYRAQIYDSGSLTHHMEFRGKPKEGTDFDVVVFGSSTDQPNSPSGVTAYGVGRSQLGNGWTASGTLNYTSTLLFRQDWSQSYNETVGSEIHSSGVLDKSWSTYTADILVSRTQLFQSVEQQVSDPVTGQQSLVADAVTIRKLPEGQFTSRDHDIWRGLPLWYSFDASAGLLFRSQPFFDSNNQLTDRFETSAFTDRVRFAPHLTTALHLGALNLVPSIGIEEIYYSESQTPYLDHYHAVGTDLVRSSRDFSLDLIFPSLERIYAKKTFLGDKLKHVIEPRATYRYVTGVGPDFNRFIRFDENDLRANTNEVEISLVNRLYAKRGDTVREVFTWEVEQKRYFDPTFGGALITGQRNVFESTADLTGYAFLVGPRSTSPVVSLVRVSPVNGLSIQWQTDYDHRMHAIVNSALSMDYRWKKFLVSGGNNEVHSSPLLTPYANQFRARAGFGDTNHRGWNAAVDAIYDYRQRAMLYATTQVTYNTDCCGLSVQYRRVHRVGLSDENLYSVSFSVANIGAFGTLKKQDRLF